MEDATFVVVPNDAPPSKAVARPRPRKPRAPAPPPPRKVRPMSLLLLPLAAVLLLVALFGAVNPPTTPTILGEGRRLGGVDHAWVPLEDIAPVMARAAVAAEDANFCAHWGLDLQAIRLAAAEGGARGASTISQQVVKNVYLWQGRSWARKAIEAALTPVVEAFWSKRRILEVYLNVAEFGEGVFGVEAAAHHWFGVPAAGLSDVQAARLAAILPDPKHRDPADPTEALRARARSILDGAATIAADGRAACFETGAAP
ncbi:monofunctional biosynthetic peptidoglycan transglycosylase [Rubellimicrobium aerolatum]|nr:monofunctional biosynthetic peptidoglycan transglycosylase [Rubellimicrobium aerolatum]